MITIVDDSLQVQHLVSYPVLGPRTYDLNNIQFEQVWGDSLITQTNFKCGGSGTEWYSYEYCYNVQCQGTSHHDPGETCPHAGTSNAAYVNCVTQWASFTYQEAPCETIDAGNSGGGGGGTSANNPPPTDDSVDDPDRRNITIGVNPNDGLNPPSNEQQIENNFDTDGLDDCSSEILTKLKNNVKSDMAEILEKLGGSETIYTTRFESGDYSQNVNNAFTNWKDNSYSNFYEYDIKIQNHHKNNATDLGIAQTLLHELTHAYFLSLIDDCRVAQNCAPLQTYPQLWQYYVEIRTGVNPNSFHHSLMADLFVKTIASALQEFHTGIPIPEGESPDELYRDLAWSGLEGTAAWNTLSPTEQFRISKRITAEDFNQSQYGSGGLQLEYFPQGQLCD